ncbi:MAG: sugar kinase [Streptosporangiales bacterium]|nr:sugar kinase [Streptosporangiales bacterium]
MTEVVLGVDIGTLSSKGLLVGLDGQVLATAVREHEMSTPRPGWAEHDAERIWWGDCVEITRELMQHGHQVVAVGVSGIGPCLLPCDADGDPLRPAILYGVDTRASEEIDQLTAKYGADTIRARCGAVPTSQAAGPKLRWVRDREPDVWARTAYVHMSNSFLTQRLTGAYVLDHPSASQFTPLYDPTAQAWIPEWVADVAGNLALPELAWPSDVVGTVTAEAAETTGLPAGVPVVAGTIDAWSESVSVGVKHRGDVMLMYGTTMFLIELTDSLLTWPTLWGTCGAFRDTYNLAAGMATSGAVTDWLRRITGSPFEDLVEEARAVGPGAEGLVMLPYFSGERTPLFDADARGVVAGLTLRHGREHLYRAALEATAFGVRHNLEAMGDAGGEARRLVAVGGGTKGGLWTQIVSDVIGQPQQLPRSTVGAAYGNAVLAAFGSRAVTEPETERWNPVEHVVEPNPAHAEAYDRLYQQYRDLYPATKDITHTLAAIQREGVG